MALSTRRTFRVLAAAALCTLGTLIPQTAHADVGLPPVFGPNMVFQRDRAVPVWGWADPGENVAVVFGDQTVTTTADDEGNWRVMLEAMKASGDPKSLVVEGSNRKEFKNVVVGEVWLCSGQSNMQWTVAASLNFNAEKAAADYPLIRHFGASRTPAGTPQRDQGGGWLVCSPKTVGSFSAAAYFFGRHLHEHLDGVPIGLINASWGGTRIEPWTPLEGFESVPKLGSDAAWVKGQQAAYAKQMRAQLPAIEAWVIKAKQAVAAGKPMPAAPAIPVSTIAASHQNRTALYNGMIHPLVPFGIRGAIWYQGEANVNEGMHYAHRLTGLINGWREVFGIPDMPFGVVLLAPYSYGNARGVNLPALWEAQAYVAANVPNTGLAVTTDVGNPKDIHPKNKQVVGERLGLWARATVYGQKDVVYSGPVFDKLEREDAALRLHFKHTAKGLMSRDEKPLTHFEVADDSGQFAPAEAVIEGDSILVKSAAVLSPTQVRFAWANAAEPNLVNSEGLPAVPFRSGK